MKPCLLKSAKNKEDCNVNINSYKLVEAYEELQSLYSLLRYRFEIVTDAIHDFFLTFLNILKYTASPTFCKTLFNNAF